MSAAIPVALLLAGLLLGAIIVENTSIFGKRVADTATITSTVTETVTASNSTSTTPFITAGGGKPVTDQISMAAYDYGTIASGLNVIIEDTGSTTISISSIFFDGEVATISGTGTHSGCATGTAIAPGTTCQFVLDGAATSATSGTSHSIKVLTSTGGTLVASVMAGRTG
ncbi:MAG: hypothetical protein OK442_04585 [Thaumarchaeota archaeon]|nr:hypothetical protein [Nitrososphaerota archaeon]